MVDSFLIFTSVNLLVQAIPNDFSISTPHHMRFLDPDGDGILTEAELTGGIAIISAGLLKAVLSTCLGWWFLLAKQPPKDYDGKGKQGFPHLFWRALLEKRGLAVIAQLAMSVGTAGAVALVWFKLFGLTPQTVLTFSGVGGIAFGFASQNLIGNWVGSLLILLTRPFKEGDFIESGGVTGHIKRVGWNFTEVQTLHGPVVYLPNSELTSTTTLNRTASSQRQLSIEVPVRFPKGGFSKCPAILRGLEKHVLESCKKDHDIVEGPEAVLKGMEPGDFSNDPLAVISIELLLNNDGLSELDVPKSDATIAAMCYLQEQGCEVVGLEQ